MAATLRAAVEIHDRATSSFNRMVGAADRFEQKLDKIDRKLNLLEYKMRKIGLTRMEPKLLLDDSQFQTRMAAAQAQMAAASAARVSPSGPGGIPHMPRGGGVTRDRDIDIDLPGDGRRGIFSRLALHQANNGVHGFIQVAVRAFKMGFHAISTATTALVGGAFQLLSRGLINLSFLAGDLGPQLASVGMHVGKMGAAIGAAAGPVAGIGIIMGLLAAAVGGASAAIVVLTSLLTSLLVPLAAIVPLLSAAVGGFVAVGVPMFMWLKETKDLVDAKKQLEERLKTLTPGTQEYTKAVQDLVKTNQQLEQNGGAEVLSQLMGLMTQLKDAVMTTFNKRIWAETIGSIAEAFEALSPIISEMVGLFSIAMRDMMRGFAEFAQSAQGKNVLRDFMVTLVPIFKEGIRVAGQFALMMINIGRAAGPIAGQLLRDLGNWMAGLNAEWSKPGGLQGMKQFFNEMYPIFKQIVDVVVAFVGGFVAMGREGAPMAKGFLEWLMDVGPRIADTISNMAEKWGPVFVEIMGVIGRLIGLFLRFAGNLAENLMPVLMVIFGEGGIIDRSIGILNTILDIFDSLGVNDLGKVAFEGIAAILQLVADALGMIKSAMEWLRDNIEAIAEKITSALGPVADVVGAIGSALGGAFGGGNNAAAEEDLRQALPGVANPGGGAPAPQFDPETGERTSDSRPRRRGNSYHIQEVHVQAGDVATFADEIERLARITPLESGSGPSK